MTDVKDARFLMVLELLLFWEVERGLFWLS